MKIMENLWQVGGAEYTTVEDAAVYLVRLGSKAVLIDSGCGAEHEMLVDNISQVLPPDVEIEFLFLQREQPFHDPFIDPEQVFLVCRSVNVRYDRVFEGHFPDIDFYFIISF